MQTGRIALLSWTLAAVLAGEARADTVSDGCPCSTWPESACVADEIAITVDDPRPEGFGSTRDLGTSAPATISFRFDRSHSFGCYANGFDIWVEDPGSGVVVSGITPESSVGRNGWAVDLADDSRPFDSRWGRAEPPALPFVAKAKELGRAVSITKMVSYSDAEVGTTCKSPPYASSNGPCTKLGYTLTIVPTRPPANGATEFRPPWTGVEKPSISTDAIQWAKLPDLDPAGFTLQRFAELQRWCTTTLYTWSSLYGENFQHPHFNLPEYGADIHDKTHACLQHTLFRSAFTEQERRKLVIASVQMGIDLFYTLRASPDFNFRANAGFGQGRFLPVAYAAVLLDHEVMKRALSSRFTIPIGPGGVAGDEFSIDGHVQIGSGDRVLWGARVGNQTCPVETRYWSALSGGSGAKDCADPLGHIDGGNAPGGSYQACCSTASYRGAVATLYMIPDMARLAIAGDGRGKKSFDYVERVERFGAWTLPDPRDRFPAIHGTAMTLYHNDRLGEQIYRRFADCARTTRVNASGQPALGELLGNCPGQVAPVGSDLTPPLPPQLLP